MDVGCNHWGHWCQYEEPCVTWMMSCGMLSFGIFTGWNWCFQVPWRFWHSWALNFLVCSMDIQLLRLLNFYLSRWPRGYVLETNALSEAVLKGHHIQVWTVGGFWTWSRSSSKHKTSLQVPCQVNALNHLMHVGSGSSRMSEPQRRFFVRFMMVQSGNQKAEHLQAVRQLNSFARKTRAVHGNQIQQRKDLTLLYPFQFPFSSDFLA